MELPIGLKNIIEEMASEIETGKLTSASRNITEKYKNESGNGKRLVSDTAETDDGIFNLFHYRKSLSVFTQ